MSRARCLVFACCWVGATVAALGAAAAEFRAVGDAPAVLYDAPSTKAKKLFAISRGYPVEVVVALEGWTKVRDAQGDLSWIENRNLGDKRTVMVKVARAEARLSASDNAPVAFQAEQNVVLDLVELGATGWVQVRHRDGQTGYVKLNQVWGL